MTYKYYLCCFGENLMSKAYTDKVECLEDFIKEIKTNENCFWGQFIECSNALGANEVTLTLEGLFSK